jgi:hypothetical protein
MMISELWTTITIQSPLNYRIFHFSSAAKTVLPDVTHVNHGGKTQNSEVKGQVKILK